MSNPVIIVQARMTSTRLPGKVLKTVLGKTMLEFLVERLRRVRNVHRLVIATTDNATDEPIVKICTELGVDCFRGSELDVLARYHGAAVQFRADPIIRVTSDCPVIDPTLVESVVDTYLKGSFDYVCTDRGTYPVGMNTEVVSFAALERAMRDSVVQYDREHVTPYIYKTRPDLFRIHKVVQLVDQSSHRWTLDTADDLQLLSLIFENLYPSNKNFSIQDMITLMEKNPDWKNINKGAAK